MGQVSKWTNKEGFFIQPLNSNGDKDGPALAEDPTNVYMLPSSNTEMSIGTDGRRCTLNSYVVPNQAVQITYSTSTKTPTPNKAAAPAPMATPTKKKKKSNKAAAAAKKYDEPKTPKTKKRKARKSPTTNKRSPKKKKQKTSAKKRKLKRKKRKKAALDKVTSSCSAAPSDDEDEESVFTVESLLASYKKRKCKLFQDSLDAEMARHPHLKKLTTKSFVDEPGVLFRGRLKGYFLLPKCCRVWLLQCMSEALERGEYFVKWVDREAGTSYDGTLVFAHFTTMRYLHLHEPGMSVIFHKDGSLKSTSVHVQKIRNYIWSNRKPLSRRCHDMAKQVPI